MVMPFAGPTAPSGWLLCDGTAKAVADYPVLFDAIRYTYGGAGATFNLPNLKGRVIVGVDAAQTEFDTLAETGGFKTHTITAAELPGHTHGHAHTHGMNTVSTSHAHNVYATAGEPNTGTVSEWHAHNYDHWHVASTASVRYMAGAQAHEHGGGAGVGSEQPNPNSGTAAAVPVNVTGTGSGGTGNPTANHVHGYDHDHPSTNYENQSPWGGNWEHYHTTNTQSASTTDAGTGGNGAHNNLQPYMAMNYLIKT
jgi:microcystin-dependent protein